MHWHMRVCAIVKNDIGLHILILIYYSHIDTAQMFMSMTWLKYYSLTYPKLQPTWGVHSVLEKNYFRWNSDLPSWLPQLRPIMFSSHINYVRIVHIYYITIIKLDFLCLSSAVRYGVFYHRVWSRLNECTFLYKKKV